MSMREPLNMTMTYHPTGVIIDIIGTNVPDRCHSCEEHDCFGLWQGGVGGGCGGGAPVEGADYCWWEGGDSNCGNLGDRWI